MQEIPRKLESARAVESSRGAVVGMARLAPTVLHRGLQLALLQQRSVQR